MSGAQSSPTKGDASGKEEEDDLTYDEYDLSKECDMVVTCKSCDTEFKSLEKFILHKKSHCKNRQVETKVTEIEVAEKEVAESAQEETSRRPEAITEPWIFENLDFEESEEARGKKRKLEERDSPQAEEVETTTKRMSKVYSRTKRTIDSSSSPPAAAQTVAGSSTSGIDTTDRRRATTIPDEVKRLSTGVSTEPKRAQKAFFDSDSEDDMDIQELVTVTVSPPNQESDDSDAEMPVEIKANPLAAASPTAVSQSNRQQPVHIAPLPAKKGITPYKLIRVVEIEKKVVSQPSLGLTLADLMNVKVLNLLAPLPAPEIKGLMVYENMGDGSLMEAEQTVLATTKDSHWVKLTLRRILSHPPTSKLIASSVKIVEQIKNVTETAMIAPAEGFDVEEKGGGDSGESKAADSTASAAEEPPKITETNDTAAKAESAEETSGCSGTEFEHDADLYAYLRDDEHYTLGPKQQHRLSRLEIKNREDCDWLTRRCFRCNTLYSCLKTLINHMNYQHADRKAFFPCIYCRNIYSQQKNLSRHLQKTHNKTKDFVDRLRPFIRNQAFVRQVKNLGSDNDILTEENDPFLRNLRRRLPPSNPTKFSSISDADILARYGRKVKMIGRPPGRPSKARASNVSLTCTMCSTSINSYREMLRHFKDVHEYSQRKINKLRSKMVEKINDVTIKEREKAFLKSPPKSPLKSNGVTITKSGVDSFNIVNSGVDRHGRLIRPNTAASAKSLLSSHSIVAKKIFRTPVVSPAAPRPQKVMPPMTKVVKEPTRPCPLCLVWNCPPPVARPVGEGNSKSGKEDQVLNLVQCQTCSKVFNGTAALMKHACSPQRQNDEPVSEPAASENQLSQSTSQLIAQPELSVNKLMDSVTEDNNSATSMDDQSGSTIKFIEAASGLETLAMISTTEGLIPESPKAGIDEVQVEMPVEVPITAEMITTTEENGEQLQTLSITLEQLEQLKAGGGNIIYVVKTSDGDIEKIDDPQGMEVVEISQLAEQGATFM